MYRFLKENKSLLVILLAIIILTYALPVGGKDYVFKVAVKSLQSKADERLYLSYSILKTSISDKAEEFLSFASHLHTEDLRISTEESKRISDAMFYFVEAHLFDKRIMLVNSNGNRIIDTDTKETALPFMKNVIDDCVKHVKDKKEKEIYITAPYKTIGKNGSAQLSVAIATPAYLDKEKKQKGALILIFDPSVFLHLLPENIIIRFGNGLTIKKGKDSYAVTFLPYKLTGNFGSLKLANDTILYYKTFEVFPGGKVLFVTSESAAPFVAEEQTFFYFTLFIIIAVLLSVFFIVLLLQKKYKKLLNAQKAILYSLASLAEFRDPETGDHIYRTAEYAHLLATELKKNPKYRKVIDTEFLDTIYEAAPLHDIGKVGIRDTILLKEGKLTKEEFDTMKKHTTIGEDIIKKIIERYNIKNPFFQMAKNIIAYHHERYNGKGYPYGLKGEEIPLEARIFALADVYDALRSKRPYKEPFSHEKAAEIIKEERGEQFDPDVVDAFLRCKKEFKNLKLSLHYSP